MVIFNENDVFEFKGTIVNKISGNSKEAHIIVGPCMKGDSPDPDLSEYKCLINMNNLYEGCPEYAIHMSAQDAFETAEDFVRSGMPDTHFEFYDQLGNKVELVLSNFNKRI